MAAETGHAGGSAAVRASELRRDAERLLRKADAWERGAQGEAATATLLEQLAGTGWEVRNDLRLPGSVANVDHLLIGPGGVIVLDTKQYSGAVTVAKDTLWHNRQPRTREVAAARRHAEAVRHALAIRDEVPVEAVMVIRGARLPAPEFQFEGLTILSPDRLLAWVDARAATCDPRQVSDLMEAADMALRPYVRRPASRPVAESAAITPAAIAFRAHPSRVIHAVGPVPPRRMVPGWRVGAAILAIAALLGLVSGRSDVAFGVLCYGWSGLTGRWFALMHHWPTRTVRLVVVAALLRPIMLVSLLATPVTLVSWCRERSGGARGASGLGQPNQFGRSRV